MQSVTVDIGGPVHVVDWGGTAIPLLLIHGLGASTESWSELAPLLTRSHRVLAIDLVGHGSTPIGRRKATMAGHTSLVEGVIAALGLDRPILVGNSMGGMVGIPVAARSPQLLAGLVLIDPALPIGSWSVVNRGVVTNIGVALVPGVGRAAMHHYQRSTSPSEQVDATLEFVTADPSRVSSGYRKRAAAVVEARRSMPWADGAFISSTRSLTGLLARRRRVHRLIRRVAVPTLLVHGAEDRLVAAASAERVAELRPDWTVRILDGVGHVPQIEVPGDTAAIIEGWAASSR